MSAGTGSAYARVENALAQQGRHIRHGRTSCPGHNGKDTNLAVSQGQKGVLLKCHSHDCSPGAIAKSLGLSTAALFDDYDIGLRRDGEALGRTEVTYVYTDERGRELYQVVRFVPKAFRPRHRDATGSWSWGLKEVRRVLYNLPQVLKARDLGDWVVFVEGEKDADTLAKFGIDATTVAGGAGAPLPFDIDQTLARANVAIVPDNDVPGHQFAHKVARAISEHANEVRIVNLPGVAKKGDVSDWLAAGHTTDELMTLVNQTPRYSPSLPQVAVDLSDQVSRRGPKLLSEWLQKKELLDPPPVILPHLAWAERTTLLSAREKAGKSTLMAQAVAALSRGEAFLDGEPRAPVKTLWYAIDEPVSDTVRRFAQYGADAAMIHICDERPTAEEMRSDVLESGANLVVMDTLAELWSGFIESEKEATGVAQFLRPYRQAARDTRAALCLLHHTTKDGREYRGSVQLGACVDAILTLRRPYVSDAEGAAEEPTIDDGRRHLEGKGRSGIVVDVRLAFDGTRYVAGDAPLPLHARLLRAILDEEGSAKDLSKRLNRRYEDVLIELRSLKSNGMASQEGKGPWRLTDRGRIASLGGGPALREPQAEPHRNAALLATETAVNVLEAPTD